MKMASDIGIPIIRAILNFSIYHRPSSARISFKLFRNFAQNSLPGDILPTVGHPHTHSTGPFRHGLDISVQISFLE